MVNGESSPLKINQNARIARIKLDKDTESGYALMPGSHGSFLFVIDGTVTINGIILNRRDALEISGCNEFKVTANANSYLLNIEV